MNPTLISTRSYFTLARDIEAVLDQSIVGTMRDDDISEWHSKGSTYFDINPTGFQPPIPSSTYTEYVSTVTQLSGSSASGVQTSRMVQIPPSSTSSTANSTPTTIQQYSDDNGNASGWDGMGNGVRGGIIVATVIGLIAIICFGVWYCCGGKKRLNNTTNGEGGVLPLHIRRNRSVPNGQPEPQAQTTGDMPPPRYEEVVPAQHQTLAGGISHVRQEEDDGVVADGKTPLSEIPFEDVVLDHTTSESSSSQSFASHHHNTIGDTTGHTNS